ncbi:helix-hairpin-helix domain-containing protein [Alkalicoccus luteus]|uniref:helix-hairpin-helix domain-containing protein n=1 Tax=Alkalicoccus luteus TaxID=1237094 RepID=UPI004033271A
MIDRLKELERPLLIKAAAVCAALLAAVFLLQTDAGPESSVQSADNEEQTESASEPAPEDGPVVIEIKGEVVSPGVYTLPYGSRTVDAVEIAGGHTEQADLLAVNLAAVLMDEMSIHVPSQLDESMSEQAPADPAAEASGGTVSLNQADANMLQTLPGIGPAKSEAIIQYREEHGSFASLDQLTQVPGIGEKTLESIAPLLTLH